MLTRILFSCLLISASVWAAKAPAWQLEVERIVWVVADTESVSKGWRHLELLETQQPKSLSLELRYRSQPLKTALRWTVARLGDTVVDFIEPGAQHDAYSAFHRKHRDGVMALVHRMESMDALDAEITRYAGLGVKVLQEMRIADAQGEARYVLLDTEDQGKYVLGLVAVAGSGYPSALKPPPLTQRAPRVTQYAFAVKDLGAVSAFWEKLSWPAMSVTNPDLLDLEYRGKPGAFAMTLGWYRHTRVPYEWIRSDREPNVYADHMRVHGEGIHHLAFNVPDMDVATADWARRGFATSQAGSWGEKGKPGSGRFAYLDTQHLGGIDIELLWNYRAPGAE